jgi:hypothetical protein
MDFTASPAAGMTAATPSPELGRQRDAGFFAVERSANRLLTERLGGPLARFYLALALECPKHDPTRFPSASVADIADWTGDSPKAVRRWLTELEHRGYIAWTRPANQHTSTGELRLLVNLNRYMPATRSKPADGTPLVAPPAVDNITAEVVPFPYPALTLPETDRATLAIRDVHRTKDIHRTPEHALGNARTESGGDSSSPPMPEPAASTDLEAVTPANSVPIAEHHHRDLVTTLELAAGYVVASRERTHGPGGRGAQRKARRELEAELGEKAAAWLEAGCKPTRVAEALADRFTGTNLGAVPWSPGTTPVGYATSQHVELEAEQLEPITDDEWRRLPESVRAVMAERCPNLTPAVNR